jgi:hypothetical protein
MSNKFLKPFIPNPKILDPKVGDPLGYVTNDGLWASIPYGKKYMVIHNGNQDRIFNTYKQSVDYIKKSIKMSKKKGPIDNFF